MGFDHYHMSYAAATAAIRPGFIVTYRRPLYYGSTPAATLSLFAAVVGVMSRAVSHSKPPGKPTTIMHRPTNSEAASVALARTPNPARATSKPSSRTAGGPRATAWRVRQTAENGIAPAAGNRSGTARAIRIALRRAVGRPVSLARISENVQQHGQAGAKQHDRHLVAANAIEH
jgi:hypothetical protein